MITFKKYSLGSNSISKDIVFEWDQDGDLKLSYDIEYLKTGFFDKFDFNPKQRKKINDAYVWLKKEHPELLI